MLHNNVVWGRGVHTLGTVFLNNVLENMGKYNSQIVQFGETGTGKQPNYQLETENKKIIMHKDKKKIFISYAHADEKFHNRLMTHLNVLKKYIGGFEEWSDKKIHAGQHWKEEIKKALDDANIAILLVSTDFLASDFIENNELPPILRKAEAENTKVLCLLVEPSFFLKSELSAFQAVNKPEETLAEMEKPAQERVFLKLMDEIQRIIEVE